MYLYVIRPIITYITSDFFLSNIENGNHIAIICEDEEHVIAMIGLSFFEMLPTTKSPNGKVARLMNMYVVPQYRHMGIARKLLEMSVSYAKEHSYGKIMLNPSSMGKKLYLNYGFQLADDEYEFYIK